MKYYFTGDTHFFHTNIIRYTHRPFKSVKHMNMELIRKWNERVKPEDVVFHLGDLCFKHKVNDFRKILNGTLILIKGNHDSGNSIIEDMTIRLGGRYFHLVHRPQDACSEYNLVGHIHKKWKIKRAGNKILVNVGVDVWDYTPISIEDINANIDKFKREGKNEI